MQRKFRGWLLMVLVLSFIVSSCYRNDVSFGNLPGNNYTTVVFTDTVSPVMSTVILDSFITGGASSFLLGKYHDPFLGVISTKPFFQMTIPSPVATIPVTAQYDSIVFVIHPNKYYYGDTTRAQTISVNEVNEFINYTSGSSIYNTSNFTVNPAPLGSRTLKIRPNVDDSVLIRLDDAKGLELFNKLEQQATEVASDDNFQTYFKGVSLSVGDHDTTAVFGLDGSADNMVMRLFYHTTTPYLQSQQVDFPLKTGAFSFNQVTTDRSGTSLFPLHAGLNEFSSTKTNNLSFTQLGAGVLLKVTFPSLKGIITTDKIVELQKAVLMVRPMGGSYDLNRFKLPGSLSLASTDGTNAVGSTIISGVTPVTDEIYGLNTYYQFDITSSINTLLTTTGGEDRGFYILENNSTLNVDRAVIGDGLQPLYRTELLLTAIIINK